MFTLLKRVYALLDPRRRKQYFGLQLLFIFTALIQVAGVASVAPFVALVSNPEFIHDNAAASYVYASLGFESDRAFLVAFAIAVIAFIIFSNAVGALTIWFTVSFAQNFGVELQGALYRNYIYKDYIYHSKHNSSDMIAMIGQEAPRFIYMVMQPMLALLSQLVVIVLISVGLLVIDPMLALLAILIIGGGYLLVFRFVKLRLSYHGDRIFSTIASRLRQLTESLGGIKEVKLLATEKKYEEKIGGKNKIIARSNAVLATLGDGPRFAMETLAFCALLGLAIYLLLHEDSPAKVVPILSLYTIAGYKLLPSAQIIFKAFADIRANRSALDNLFPLVLEGRRIVEADAQVSAAPAIALGDIRCNDLCYTYPDAPAPALRNVNLTIKLNTLVAFAGSSGAGKSTLADILLG
ncbi:MAG: ATP-binding cassette domain-containing protein, partial [Nevskiaceae bacterium]|nr:ATP-binding cassette domain-containing protein [Nevskiaceae bacterium]